MEKYFIATGKSIDQAISTALAELKLDRAAVSVEVLENARSGFLGIGASPAKVKVTYEVPDPTPVEVKPADPAPALSAASRKPRKMAPKLEKPLEIPKPEPRREAPTAETPKAPRADQPKKSAPRREAPKAPAVTKTYAPAEPGSLEEKTEIFLKGLLERMGSDAVPHAVRADDAINVELTGTDLGALIGRRGETLDAIQHLANYALNHDVSKRTRVNVDAENYRGKREESLQHLARKMAAKVVKYRKNMTLEPMNAYERHVIHATLQDVPGVTTYSTGTEPNRRVIVAYEKDQ